MKVGFYEPGVLISMKTHNFLWAFIELTHRLQQEKGEFCQYLNIDLFFNIWLEIEGLIFNFFKFGPWDVF